MAVKWLNEAKEHNYIFLINNGEGARSRGTQAGEYFNVKTSAPNLNSAIYNIFEDLTGDTVEDYFEDDIPENLLDAVDEWDISGGWPWIEGIKEDGKVFREPRIEVIYHEDEGWYEEVLYSDYVEPDVIEEWDIDVTEEEYSDEEDEEDEKIPAAREITPARPVDIFELESRFDGDCTLKQYNGSEEYVVIPDGITAIGFGAFWNLAHIKQVKIPNSVNGIREYAFAGCTGLTQIQIPSSVKRIDIWAFLDCTNLKQIEIPNSVTKIDPGAFGGCSNLTVYCPKGSYAEQYCINNGIKYKTS